MKYTLRIQSIFICLALLLFSNSVLADTKFSLNKKLEDIDTRIEKLEALTERLEKLEKLSLQLSSDVKQNDTYMPGWYLLPADKQKLLWYQSYLDVDGTYKPNVITASPFSKCSGSGAAIKECIIKYPIGKLAQLDAAKGFVLRMSVNADSSRPYTSVACSTGDFPKIHWEANGFMSYLSKPAASSQYHGSVVFCPAVEENGEKFIIVKYAANGETSTGAASSPINNPKFYTTASLLGYW